MNNRDLLLHDLRSLSDERRSIQLMHDSIAELSEDIRTLHAVSTTEICSASAPSGTPAVVPTVAPASATVHSAVPASASAPHPASAQSPESLIAERRRLVACLRVTVNHVSRLERLLALLDPDEQLVLRHTLICPTKNSVFYLMEQLHCEKSWVYRIRARAIDKLLRLRYGAAAGE